MRAGSVAGGQENEPVAGRPSRVATGLEGCWNWGVVARLGGGSIIGRFGSFKKSQRTFTECCQAITEIERTFKKSFVTFNGSYFEFMELLLAITDCYLAFTGFFVPITESCLMITLLLHAIT